MADAPHAPARAGPLVLVPREQGRRQHLGAALGLGDRTLRGGQPPLALPDEPGYGEQG